MKMSTSEPKNLTHLDDSGHAHMVDVLGKDVTRRRAVARCQIEMSEAVLSASAMVKLRKEMSWA